MTLRYPANLTKDGLVTFTVTFPDIPEVFETLRRKYAGKTDIRKDLVRIRKALDMALKARVQEQRPVPLPRPGVGDIFIRVYPTTEIMLYRQHLSFKEPQ